MLKGLRKFSSFSQTRRENELRTKPIICRRSLSPDDVRSKTLEENVEDDNGTIVKKVLAKHDYVPVNVETDLALVRGVQYDILDSTGVWWMARDPETGEIGLIPFNYVQVICDDDYSSKIINKNTSNIVVDKLISSASSSTSSASASVSSSISNSISDETDSTDIHHSRTFNSLNNSIPQTPWKLETNQFTFKNSWYQPAVDRDGAEKMLLNCNRNGAFLIRPSTSETRCFTLSLLHKSEKNSSVKHYLIQQCPTSGRFYIRISKQFESLDKLIKHYRNDREHLPTVLTTIPSQNMEYTSKINQRNRILSNNNHNINNNNNNATTTSSITLGSKDKSWEIKANELQLLEELGSGQFGVVRHGKWRSRTDVAVKLMKEGTMSEEDFIDEAKVMTRLQHPNLVKLYGLCIEHRPICIVAEYLKHGSLLSFLRKNDQKLNSNTISSKIGMILLNMCSQVCSAMAYLEARNYIHRDLAARNCLVGHGGVVKVADFGLARYVIDDEYTSSGGTKFPIRWAPPEVLWYTRFSSKSDVWAYGILMWEVYTCGRLPYGKLSNAEVVEQIRQGARLECPPNPNCSSEMYQLMHVCWEESPEQRPSFQRISSYLSSLRSKEISKKH